MYLTTHQKLVLKCIGKTEKLFKDILEQYEIEYSNEYKEGLTYEMYYENLYRALVDLCEMNVVGRKGNTCMFTAKSFFISGSTHITTICGSLKFFDDMLIVATHLSMHGKCVMMPINGKSIFHHLGGYSEQKGDVMTMQHKAKINLADDVIIVHRAGYVGRHTLQEIEYCDKHAIPVSYVCIDEFMKFLKDGSVNPYKKGLNESGNEKEH